ncbi:TetR/AcrR family transcriptional regulator [Cellulomonas sp. S1-8]|uniref:TetR/AcrR family transcriptional regulator n=1 Tax=Cellulomonas sp. S1-8 TaxID=2904790 RepID=UPI002244E19D|nr:TetR family transcriptional regulator [Cellulomonas sp. S1-8]UZN01474.1 TetR family transcriptional regulator [Cellulomonas sp. S1-8]
MDGLRRDAARNRARILDAARDLAAQDVPLALNAVARAADVGVGTVYRHFATADELEETLVWEQLDALAEILRHAEPAQLEHVLTAHFTLLVEDAVFERVTARARPVLDRTATTRTALVGRLANLLERARTQGAVRADVDAAGVLLLMCGLAHAVRSAEVAADSVPARALLRVVLDGLRAP